MNDYKVKFGKRLQEIRKMRRFTQLMLAEKVEVDAKYISRIESGISSPSFEMITKFALALEVQPELLFRFPESESKEDLIKGINQKLEKTDLAIYNVNITYKTPWEYVFDDIWRFMIERRDDENNWQKTGKG